MKLEQLIGGGINDFWRFQVEKGLLTEPEASNLSVAMEALLYKLRSCLLCYLIGEREYHFTSRLQYALIQEPSLLEEFQGHGGFCQAHAWYLQDITSPSVNATLYRSLLEAIDSRFQELTPLTVLRENRSVQAVLCWLVGPRVCPICQDLERFERVLVEGFATALEASRFREVYLTSRGLCFPHMAEMLRFGTPETVRFLLEAHRTHLEKLVQELNEFERKVKARDRDYGESRDAWRRAIHLWAGRKGG